MTRRRGGNWKPTRPERLASGARRGRVVTIKLLGSGGNRQRLSKRRQLTLLVVGGRLCGGGGSRLRWLKRGNALRRVGWESDDGTGIRCLLYGVHDAESSRHNPLRTCLEGYPTLLLRLVGRGAGGQELSGQGTYLP